MYRYIIFIFIWGDHDGVIIRYKKFTGGEMNSNSYINVK